MRPRALALVLALAGAPLGCGYDTGSMLPGGAQAVAVDVFENDTFYRELEITLARRLTRELRRRTTYRIASRDEADVILDGRILRVDRPVLVETEDDLVSEQGVTVTAHVELTRRADGVVLDAFDLSNRAEFVVERGETLETAFEEALGDLAEDILARLEHATYRESLARARRG